MSNRRVQNWERKNIPKEIQIIALEILNGYDDPEKLVSESYNDKEYDDEPYIIIRDNTCSVHIFVPPEFQK
jgi:hypothetical protein